MNDNCFYYYGFDARFSNGPYRSTTKDTYEWYIQEFEETLKEAILLQAEGLITITHIFSKTKEHKMFVYTHNCPDRDVDYDAWNRVTNRVHWRLVKHGGSLGRGIMYNLNWNEFQWRTFHRPDRVEFRRHHAFLN